MQYQNATDLKWIPWFRYALLLRIDGKQIISLGRFRQAISAHRESWRLKELKGYEPQVVDTKECKFKEFHEAYR
jgi:hypothetical protein